MRPFASWPVSDFPVCIVYSAFSERQGDRCRGIIRVLCRGTTFGNKFGAATRRTAALLQTGDPGSHSSVGRPLWGTAEGGRLGAFAGASPGSGVARRPLRDR